MISSPFGRKLRFLVDTGASNSFIDPKFVPLQQREPLSTNTVIKTVLREIQVTEKVEYPAFSEFNLKDTFIFLLLKFHEYFDGLIGLDILSTLKANIDFKMLILQTPEATIPIHIERNRATDIFNIEASSGMLVRLPVECEQGPFLLDSIELLDNVYIQQGLYTADNYSAWIEMVNYSDQDQTICLENPLSTTQFIQEKYVELNFHWHDEDPPIDMKNDANFHKRVNTDHLSDEETKQLKHLCFQFPFLFHDPKDRLTFSNTNKHKIETTDEIPLYAKPFRYSYQEQKEIFEQVQNMLEQNIIRESHSPWSSPVWLVPKKSETQERKWRLVIDYRKLNEKTVKDRYPIPNINEVLDKIGRARYFSTLDLASGYHQIQMEPKDIPKTAFTALDGHYEFIRMPFGLTNAPATFQRVMNNVLGNLKGRCCLVYLDDIIVFSGSLQQHISDLKEVFKKISDAKLKLHSQKSKFLRKETEFLGHIVTDQGIKPNPDKIIAIKKFPLPRSKREIKSFLGLLGYYRKFIKDMARITKPLTAQLKGDRKSVTIDQEYVDTFEKCKTLLCNDPLLQYPDFSKRFILTTDASNVALGAVLSQGPLGSDKPVCFASRTLSDTERNYATVEKEMLAIIWAVKYFRPYLFGRSFVIITDHKPLTWLMSFKEPTSKIVRWRMQLAEYDYEVLYKKGSQNLVADALSRVVVDVNMKDRNSVAGTCGDTIHSASEHLDDHIYISEKPLNDFNYQLVFKYGLPSESVTEVVFKRKNRHTICELVFNEENITQILKKYLKPNKTIAVFAPDEIFSKIQDSYKKFFANSKIYNVLRCTNFLTDLLEAKDQECQIENYHISNNHRGIDETVAHLKRQFYFPDMKTKISHTIKNCDICHTLKYNRHPPKVKFQLTETPTLPLDILHTDLYTINGKYVVTIIDKFSRFACGYTIPARDAVNVVGSIRRFIVAYGIPKKIVYDQGAEYNSNLFKDFCQQYSIERHVTSFQQSSSNSPVERLHSTITEVYRIIMEERKRKKLQVDHEEVLAEAFITYNNAIHSATKLTPYELFAGRTHSFQQTVQFSDEHDYLQKLNEFQKNIYPKVRDFVQRNKEQNIEKLNKDRKEPIQVETQDIVFRKENRRNKLTPRFSKQTVLTDGGPTFTTHKRQKIHKSKIKTQLGNK